MPSLWNTQDKLNEVASQSVNSGSLWGQTTPQPEDSGMLKAYHDTVNRVRNIGSIMGLGATLVMNRSLSPQQQSVYDALKQGQEQASDVNDQVVHDIGNMFSKASLTDTAKSLFGKLQDVGTDLITSPGSTIASGAKSLLALPYKMVEGIAGSVSGSVLGVDLSGREIRALSVDENASQVKALIGNSVAALVAPGVSKAMEAGFAAGTGGDLAAMSTPQVARIGAMNTLGVRLGPIGRAIADDVTAGAAAGIAQGAVEGANKEDILGNMGAGLLFAPLGVMFGYLRGVKGGVGDLEMKIGSAKGIKAIRDWQNINDANIESAAQRVTKLLTSDRIDEALTTEGTATRSADQVRKLMYEYQNDKVLTAKMTPEERAKFLADKKTQLETEQFKVENKPVGSTMDDLYTEFKKSLNSTDNFTSSLVSFAEQKGLREHISEMATKFSEMYVKDGAPTEEYAHLANLQKQVLEGDRGKFDMDEDTLIGHANKAGFYYTNNHGALEIRDITTGVVVNVAKTSDEALSWIEKTGKVPNPKQLDAGSVLPSDPIKVQAAPSTHPNIMADFQPIYTNRTRAMAGFDIGKLDSFTGIRPFAEAIDRLTVRETGPLGDGAGERVATRPLSGERGTSLKHRVILPLENAALQGKLLEKEYMNAPVMTRLRNFANSKAGPLTDRFKTADREMVGLMLEANDLDGLMAPNGYAQGHTVSQDALAHAQYMHDEGIDHSLVLNYRRARDAFKYQAIALKEGSALETFKNSLANGMEEHQALDAYKLDKQSYETPDFQARMQQLDAHFNPDEKFMKAVNGYDKIYDQANGTANAGAVARLKLAMDYPETYGLKLQDFIDQHKISPDVVKLHGMTKDAFDYFATSFGIDGRKIMNFMNHYRQLGDIGDAFIMDSFEHGIMDGSTRQFASAMVRSGEIANYSKDAIGNLQSYIRGGAKRGLYKTLEQIVGDENGELAQELKKIQNPTMRDMVIRRVKDYQRDITGQQSIGQKEALNVQVEMLKHMIQDENGRRLSADDIIKAVNHPNNLDTLLNLSSAGLLGGRVSLALRDNFDVYQKYFVRNGPKRLYNLLFKTKVGDDIIDKMVSAGDIVNPEPADVINVTHNLVEGQNIPGKTWNNIQVRANEASKELARFGFETSLQGRAYLKNQAAVFLETHRATHEVLTKLGKGELTKEAAYKELFINKFDPETQHIFDAYVKDGNFNSASRLLAQEEIVASVGRMTRGNQAPIMSSGVGKLFGQMGSWGMANRSVFENMLTRGTTDEVARSMVRYGISTTATIIAGQATGLNLGRWLLLPTSLIATGGPVLGTAQAINSAITTGASNDASQTNFANRALKTGMSQFVPFAYAGRDVIKAADLAANGSGYGIMRPAMQAIGLGVNKTERNMLDWVMGNYPEAPPPLSQR